MEKTIKNTEKTREEVFISEYEKIVTSSKNSVVIENEWINKGDYFQKLSLYDNSYRPIQSLGNTTLIKAL
ncbi:hypothetical protein LNI88_11785 [Tenacibaculum dicentrarchi]|nr:hypothetical protein [Tenacibaculum dicentrarchi]